MVRKAQAQDINEVSDLILMASSVIFEDITKSKDIDVQKELLKKLYLQKNSSFYYDNILVYIHDNKVVGCIVFYPANNETKQQEVMQEYCPEYTFDQEGIQDTIYIDSLAVNNDYQGLGISKKLFNYLFDNYNEDFSLLVEEHKTKTKAYYERLGFEDQGLEILFNAPVYRMLKKNKKDQ